MTATAASTIEVRELGKVFASAQASESGSVAGYSWHAAVWIVVLVAVCGSMGVAVYKRR